MHPVALDRVRKCPHDRLLAHHLSEALGPVAAIEGRLSGLRRHFDRVYSRSRNDPPKEKAWEVGGARGTVMQDLLQAGAARLQEKDCSSDVRRVSGRVSIVIAALMLLVFAVVPSAQAAMQSVELGRNLCHTVGGGKFKDIPGFPGEKIDRRLLKDIEVLKRKYKIFITDGYSTDPVHSANGEHPLGLALDIVPNFAKGGDWDDIDRLAEWAEPRQNEPRAPFRWVGYDGDAHHGRGHHLHLSYNHGASQFGTPVREMYSMRCPERRGDNNEPDGGGDGGDGGGGIGTRSAPVSDQGVPLIDLGPVTPETGGIGL